MLGRFTGLNRLRRAYNGITVITGIQNEIPKNINVMFTLITLNCSRNPVYGVS
jgi:hypothetical protein